MELVPFYISLGFIGLTVYTIAMCYRASNKNKGATLIVLGLALVQAVLSQRGFFLAKDAMPPRIMFILLPSVVCIVLAFVTKSGQRLINSFNLQTYSYLHTVRVGVEVVLYYLFLYQLVPESMTFSDRNFDIVAGLTAPFVAYFGFKKGRIGKRGLLVWNWICLLLVCQVVIAGIFSVPSPFQLLSFETPNTGILHFPFVWLPGIIVPVVIFGHIVTIKRLSQNIKQPF